MSYFKMKMKTTDASKTMVDSVIAEVRRHKTEIAEDFGFDVFALGRSLQQREIGDARFQSPRGEQGGGGLATRPESNDPS